MSDNYLRTMRQRLEFYSDKVDQLEKLSSEEKKDLITKTKLQIGIADAHAKYIVLELQHEISKEKIKLEREKRKALTIKPTLIENGYWEGSEGLKHIKEQVIQFNQTNNKDPRYMPTSEDFNDPRYEDLVNAIIDHGGFKVVAEKLGLRFE